MVKAPWTIESPIRRKNVDRETQVLQESCNWGTQPGLGKGCHSSVMVTLDSPSSDLFVPAWRGRPE